MSQPSPFTGGAEAGKNGPETLEWPVRGAEGPTEGPTTPVGVGAGHGHAGTLT